MLAVLLSPAAGAEEPALDLFAAPAAELSAEQKQLAEAVDLLGSGNRAQQKRGFRQAKLLADGGLEAAQLKISEAYFGGLGVPKDAAAAWGWYEKAAAQGSARALHFLSLRYRYGCGAKKDLVKADDYLKRAKAYAKPEELTAMETSAEGCGQFGKK
ncbi:MAG: sel1 repeat family protein [Proteobacteria bacterium]|nr:MAG: sel1 repeat family protein [Pseudomonadota bacterium]